MPGPALRLLAVWLSPAALLGLGPLLLADGTRGLWPPLALAAGAVLAAVVLAGPWGERPFGRGSLVDLVAHRWPDAVRAWPLLVVTLGGAFLFLWAQLAAVAELGVTWGGSRPVVTAVATLCLALAAWRREAAAWLGGVGAALAVGGLVVPLAAVVVTTDPVWPRVWEAVVSRPRTVFGDTGPWVGEGHAVHGRGGEVTLRTSEEQRVTLLGPGRVRIELWEGRATTREIASATDVTLRVRDRLTVPDGFPMRFQAGRRIPGGPPSGLGWLDPGPAAGDRRWLLGVGLTLVLGALGLAPVHAALAGGPDGTSRAAALAAVLATFGLMAAVAWGLYTAWLAPEVYIGGVAGGEIFELPALVPALGAAGGPLRDLALLGLAGGAMAAGVAALTATPASVSAAARIGGLAVAGALAALAPVESWSLLLAAFGLAAAGGAAPAVTTCWRERLGPRAVVAGATAGLAAFVALSAVRLFGLAPGPGTAWVTEWPVVVAAPLSALVTSLASRGPRPSAHAPLPTGLAALHPPPSGESGRA
jgi:hypothetical protein